MTRVRRVPPIDAIDQAGERVVLLPGRAVRVAGIAPTVLDLTGAWTSVPDLVVALEQELGTDPDGGAAALVGAAVEQLAREGLLEFERD